MLAKLMRNKIGLGVCLSISAFILSLVISYYSYSFLWRTADRELFAIWMVVFEFSQFLLLLDVGFTHSFIKKNVNADGVCLIEQLPQLRGALCLVGLLAAVVVTTGGFWTGGQKIGSAPYFFLAISIGLTLISYADTAVLRIMQQFKWIYAINIFGNIVFFIFLSLGWIDDVIDRLAVATFLRSLISYACQSIIVGAGFSIAWPKNIKGSAEVVGLNASYFFLFMLDGFILATMGVPLVVVASVIVLRKYFDALRGLWDAALSVISIAFARANHKARDWAIRCLVVSSFFCAWLSSSAIIELWLGKRDVDDFLAMAVCVSVMALTLFRVETTRLYYQGGFGMALPIIFALIIKGVFSFSLYMNYFGVAVIYLLQAGLLLGAVCAVDYLSSRRNKAPNC